MKTANHNHLILKVKTFLPNRLLSIVIFLIIASSSTALKAQLAFNSRSDNLRVVVPGKGQEHKLNFTFVKSFHFVQFGVYSTETNRYDIKSPNVNEQIWLIEHHNTQIEGESWNGAYYVVKPCQSEDEARAYAKYCRSIGLECWYNASLSDVPFTLHGFCD